MNHKDGTGRAEDNLADSIADIWQKIDSEAAAKKDAEAVKSEAFILEWAGKLAEILKGPRQ
jgi:hypothetical protein